MAKKKATRRPNRTIDEKLAEQLAKLEALREQKRIDGFKSPVARELLSARVSISDVRKVISVDDARHEYLDSVQSTLTEWAHVAEREYQQNEQNGNQQSDLGGASGPGSGAEVHVIGDSSGLDVGGGDDLVS